MNAPLAATHSVGASGGELAARPSVPGNALPATVDYPHSSSYAVAHPETNTANPHHNAVFASHGAGSKDENPNAVSANTGPVNSCYPPSTTHNSAHHLFSSGTFDHSWLLNRQPLQKLDQAIIFEASYRRDKTQKVAVEIYISSKCDKLAVDEEIIALAALSQAPHTNVIRMLDAYQTDVATYIVLERLRGPNIVRHFVTCSYYASMYSEIVIRRRCRDILSAVQHCHRNCIIHRDIKPANFTLARDSYDADMKLTNFRNAVRVPPNTLVLGVAGTQAYLAPEVIQNAPYTSAVDMWAIGVSVFLLLTGELPFEANGKGSSIANKLNCKFGFSPSCRLSKYARDFIQKLLVVEAGCRMTAEEALQHPWVRNILHNWYLGYAVSVITDCQRQRERKHGSHSACTR
jgi:serine/threonine protein kinase